MCCRSDYWRYRADRAWSDRRSVRRDSGGLHLPRPSEDSYLTLDPLSFYGMGLILSGQPPFVRLGRP